MTKELLGRVHRELLDVLNSINQDKIHHDGDDFHELLNDVEKALAEHAMSEVQRLGQEIEQEPVELCQYGQEPASCTSNPMDCQCAIDAALAQPEQEPVAWQWLGSAHFRKKLPKNADITAWNPLYTTPPQRKPLTDDLYNELLFAVGNKCPNETRHQTALRYILQAEKGDEKAAHGIKGDA